jgi:hypothetical protein
MAKNAKNGKNCDGQGLKVYFLGIFPSFLKLYNFFLAFEKSMITYQQNTSLMAHQKKLFVYL